MDNVTFVDLSPPNINITKITSSLADLNIVDNATNTKTLELFWEAQDNNELIVGFDFYYKYENSSWIQEKIGFIQKSSTFYAEEDGYYQFKIVGNDLAYPAMISFLPSGLLGLLVASLIAVLAAA